MTCCEQPRVRQNDTHTAATCECGFQWKFDYQGKGKFKSKTEKWGPAWFCSDDYDRAWRLKNYTQHEVIGTKRRGAAESYLVGCPRSGTTISVDRKYPPDEVYCPECDRSGLFGPMLTRHRSRAGQ